MGGGKRRVANPRRHGLRARQRYVPASRLGTDVTTRAATGTMWSGVGIAAGTMLQLARSMVFARLLQPADFGIVNLAGVFAQFVMIFANFGFAASVVHHDGLNRQDLSTCFWGNLAVDGAAALACCLVALVAGRLTDNAMLLPVVALLASQFVIVSLASVNQALLRRQFRYRELAIADFSGAVVTFAAGYVIVAVLHWGVYGLVGGMVLASLTSSTLLVTFLPWAPSFSFSRASLRRHLNFGRGILGVSVVTYANVNADRVVIGHLLSTTQLGFYEYAGNIPLQVVTRISQVFNDVIFSAVSSLKENVAEVRELLRKFYRYNSLLSFPVLVGIALVAPEFVAVAYGDKWLPIVPTIRLFCLYGVLQLYVQPFHSICNGMGLTHLPLRWMLIFLPVNLSLIWIGVHYGQLNGVVLMRSAMPLFVVLTLGVQVMRRVQVPWSTLVMATLPAVTGCTVMAAVVLVIDRAMAARQHAELAHLLVATLGGAVTYGAIMILFWRQELAKMLALVRHSSS
jgi:O-antigen/teichoic acid export membrane protein